MRIGDLPGAGTKALTRALATALAAIAIVVGAALVPGAVRPVAAADVTIDRAFGYLLGDVVVATTTLPVEPRAEVSIDGLPRAGRLNAWLNLLEIDVVRDGGQLTLSRRFQLTASAEQVKLLYLPRAEVRLRVDGRERVERLPAVPLTVSPLSGRQPITRSGLGDLRPDWTVPAPDPARIDRWLGVALGALVLALSAALLVRWRVRRIAAFAPFRSAARELTRRARSRRTGAADLSEGYRILHRAFDLSAGHTLFAGNLDSYLRDHPRLAQQRQSIAAFFARSTQRFFDADRPSAEAGASEFRRLHDLARGLARLDTGNDGVGSRS